MRRSLYKNHEEARQFYSRNAVKVADKNSDAVAFIKKAPVTNRTTVSVFYGKQSKPVLYCYYTDETKLQDAVKRYFESRQQSLARKEKNREERKAKANTLQVGDILYTSWGYDQTNVEFYQVTAILGKRKIELREIASETVEGSEGFMSDSVVAVKDSFVGPAFTRLANDDSVKVEYSQYARKWDDKPRYRSWYA